MSTQTTAGGAAGLDGYFKISERGSSVATEIRGGIVTFFTMSYIVVLNPMILYGAVDINGDKLGGGTNGNSQRSPRRRPWWPAC